MVGGPKAVKPPVLAFTMRAGAVPGAPRCFQQTEAAPSTRSCRAQLCSPTPQSPSEWPAGTVQYCTDMVHGRAQLASLVPLLGQLLQPAAQPALCDSPHTQGPLWRLQASWSHAEPSIRTLLQLGCPLRSCQVAEAEGLWWRLGQRHPRTSTGAEACGSPWAGGH